MHIDDIIYVYIYIVEGSEDRYKINNIFKLVIVP